MVNRAIREYRVGMNSSPNSPPSDAALEAWAAWQERLVRLNLTPEQKEQATAVLLRLMKLRETRRAPRR
jgi:hypothetical protein